MAIDCRMEETDVDARPAPGGAAAKRGFKASDRTHSLLRKAGDYPAPVVRSLGRGQGVTAEYPREALARTAGGKCAKLGANMLTMAQWTLMKLARRVNMT